MSRPSSLAPSSLASSTLPGGAAARAGSRLDQTSRDACRSPLASRSTKPRRHKPRTALVDQPVYGGTQSVVQRWRASLSARLGGLAKDCFAQRAGRLTSITQARSTRRTLRVVRALLRGGSLGSPPLPRPRSTRLPSMLVSRRWWWWWWLGRPGPHPGASSVGPLLPAQVESTVTESGQSAAKKGER